MARSGWPDTTLVANGWVYPTDSSINVAIGQGGHDNQGVSRSRRERGGWVVVTPDLGFPAGKNKTMLIDLARCRRRRRLRLRTNLEISWDRLRVAERARGPRAAARGWTPPHAELRYRGFSKTSSPRGRRPKRRSTSAVANIAQRWRDLVGYYTRFGDVRGAADRRRRSVRDHERGRRAVACVRRAPPPPARAGARDFVLIGDGWEKTATTTPSSRRPCCRCRHTATGPTTAPGREPRRSRTTRCTGAIARTGNATTRGS